MYKLLFFCCFVFEKAVQKVKTEAEDESIS